jgi:hypothetical protein
MRLSSVQLRLERLHDRWFGARQQPVRCYCSPPDIPSLVPPNRADWPHKETCVKYGPASPPAPPTWWESYKEAWSEDWRSTLYLTVCICAFAVITAALEVNLLLKWLT